jgi:predicted outer membrane repeat protein
MFKIIGACVVYGFAAYGLSVLMQTIEGNRSASESGGAIQGTDRRFNVVK